MFLLAENAYAYARFASSLVVVHGHERQQVSGTRSGTYLDSMALVLGTRTWVDAMDVVVILT